MFEKLFYFLRLSTYKFRRQNIPNHITLVNKLPEDKKKYISGSINLCHWKGHNCILLVVDLDRFYHTHRHLFNDSIYWFYDD